MSVLRERAEKVVKLEADLLRCKNKINEMLEEQLDSARKWCQVVHGFENDILKHKAEIEYWLQNYQENARNKIKDLSEENALHVGQQEPGGHHDPNS